MGLVDLSRSHVVDADFGIVVVVLWKVEGGEEPGSDCSYFLTKEGQQVVEEEDEAAAAAGLGGVEVVYSDTVIVYH